MQKLLYKLGTGLAAASLLTGALATSAFAANVTISGNGIGSNNTGVITQSCSTTISQRNTTTVETNASVIASSGNNEASGNTTGGGGGDVGIAAGAATASLTVTVAGGTNTATGAPSCDPVDPASNVTLSSNGINTTNVGVLNQTATDTIRQRNRTRVTTNALVRARTGRNQTNNNTTGGGGGSVGVVTDPASATLGVSVTPGSSNTF
jgi:hypothetical protein